MTVISGARERIQGSLPLPKGLLTAAVEMADITWPIKSSNLVPELGLGLHRLNF